MDACLSEVMVVETGAPELSVVEREAKRLDKVQPHAGIRRKTNNVARIRGNLGCEQDDVEHA